MQVSRVTSRVLKQALRVSGMNAKQTQNAMKLAKPCVRSLHTVVAPSWTGRVGNKIMYARSMAVVTEPLESLGDSITSAVLLSWNKKPGDAVKEDDVIAVVETDKVTMDIRAKKSGVFVEALVEASGEISVGNGLYKIDTEGKATSTSSSSDAKKDSGKKEVSASHKKEKEEAAAKLSESSKSESSSSSGSAGGAPTTVNVPQMGDSISSGVLAAWSVKVGDEVKIDQVVANIETDKVTVEVRAPSAGKITELKAKDGEEVQVGNPLFVMTPSSGTAKSEPPATEKKESKDTSSKSAQSTSTSSSASSAGAVAPAPTAGDAGKKEEKKASAAPSGGASSGAKPAAAGDRSEQRVKMTRMRQRISTRLKESQNTAAMLTTFQEVDMGYLMDLRNKYKDDFEKTHGVKLGFMSAFVRAATAALQEIPAVNAVIDDSTQEIVYRNYCDVSVAVASPNGLVVPVLRNTEKMSFADVEKTIANYGKKAKEGSLALEDMAGGTFTISNGGIFGSLFGTPIINPPQSAILGMHATKMRPVVTKDGKIEARPMMYLALTYDHRLIDGREAVTFLKSIRDKIEDPARLLLSL